MSNPYIQFELDAAKKAPTLASALGIQVREAFGGLAMMWLHVYGADKGDTVTAFYLRSFFGAPPELVGEALVELGFAERVDATTWRVKGAGRYTRLTEIRREAGRKGAAATNSTRPASAAANDRSGSANADDGPANGRQTVGKTPHEAASARQMPGKTENSPASARQTVGKPDGEGRLPRQKAALDPRSDISTPKGVERDRNTEDLRRARDKTATGSALEGPTDAVSREAVGNGTRQRVPEGHYVDDHGTVRPLVTPGTPEYEQAEREGDWKALGWT